MPSRPDLPQDLAACHALIGQQQAAIDRLEEERRREAETIGQQQATIDEQQATIERLMADMALLKRALFGRRRERFVDDPRQTFLFDPAQQDAEQAPADPEPDDSKPDEARQDGPPRRKGKGRRRRVFPECLPRKEARHKLDEKDIPEDLRNDPAAKRFFKKTSEELEFEPASLYVIEHYQEVIVREEETGETTMATAPKPPRLIDAYTGPGFWAYLTASRFADHLPYYRQEDILSRHGFRIARSTQWRWMAALAEGVRPLVDLMRSRALLSRVLGADETRVTMLGGEPAGSLKSYLWATIGDGDYPYDCFYFTVGRSRAGPEKFLSGYRGYLQSDAYIGYESLSDAYPEILQVGCWAHARRKFEEVHFTAPTVRTHRALGYFQRLYDIEDRAHDFSEQQRYELRQRESKPIVSELHEWLVELYARELPKSKLRGAINYMTNRWKAFDRYLECGAIPIDNNRTEAALKYAVLGRKAWLFFGNPQAGETAAILFTLTKSCNRHRVDPFAYLRDVYTRLPRMRASQTEPGSGSTSEPNSASTSEPNSGFTAEPRSAAAEVGPIPTSELESLLPDRWIKEHPEHRIQERVDESRQRARRTRARRAQRRRLQTQQSK